MRELKSAKALAKKLADIENDVEFLASLYPESAELALALQSLKEARKALERVRVKSTSIKLPGESR